MLIRYCLEGSVSTHGCQPKATQSDFHEDGIPLLRVGDSGWCPACRCLSTIVEGFDSHTIYGKSAVLHNAQMSCGARMQAIPCRTVRELDGSEFASASEVLGPDLDPSDQDDSEYARQGGYRDAEDSLAPEQYSGRFQVVDRVTGAPMAHRRVQIRLDDGTTTDHVTDAEGYTGWVSSPTQQNYYLIDLDEDV